MKTLHRAAYEVLTPEEYKEFCRIPKELFGVDILYDWCGRESDVISQSFLWRKAPLTNTGISPVSYWSDINERIHLGINHA